MVAKVLRGFGWIWSLALALLVWGGSLAHIWFAPDRWAAVWEVQAQFSPFNWTFYLVMFLLITPAFGAWKLAEFLERRRR